MPLGQAAGFVEVLFQPYGQFVLAADHARQAGVESRKKNRHPGIALLSVFL